MRRQLSKSKRWLIKIGTSSLVASDGHFSVRCLDAIVSQAVLLIEKDIQVVLVTSGAISLGMDTMKRTKRPTELPDLQACAAIGQGKLMKAYESAFSARGLHAAQILLTHDGLQDRTRYVNAKNTIEALLKMKAVPVVNENDTVATKEIRFGDNDVLAAHVANLVDAQLLVFLSDVDGFYLKDKTIIRHIHSVQELKEYAEHIHFKKSEKTAGGMKSKLMAAKVAMQSGIPIVIANGRDENVMERILKGEEVGSIFHPSSKKMSSKEKWLTHSALSKGELVVDEGAYRALTEKKKSLLARGILDCKGTFQLGDAVDLVNSGGEQFARGIINYSFSEMSRIKGKQTDEIPSVLGYERTDEVIHRNNLVILEGKS